MGEFHNPGHTSGSICYLRNNENDWNLMGTLYTYVLIEAFERKINSFLSLMKLHEFIFLVDLLIKSRDILVNYKNNFLFDHNIQGDVGISSSCSVLAPTH
jgi:hypothetical protein